jgi:hypothetical protein
VRLEGRLAVLVVSEVKEELVDRLSKGLVLGVGIELLSDELELVRNAISVATVAATEQAVTLVVDAVPLLS